ncbi:dihydroneopterin aldolase [Brumimicrobium aurantiacum]|uniref:7,8-dihydroneopterin aldolase n=1 Tax=Brumimicrobium aurantiacum TaxID=1737063 RepID=A0A3E1F211_9FLAO|nr:dihydroneopterin aldolase [Brumimicrobium aurantiacum]RFC55871.1 dihydroneopterin aldolase [Brumimicrobium aurantiacum]
MQHTIEVNGIKRYAYHGCLEEEGKIGGHYTVDVSIVTDFTASFASDELSDTVDYVKINQIVAEEMDIRSKLIEHVGYRILQRLQKEIDGVIHSRVKVIKHCPPIGGDVNDVAIIIEQ